MELVADGNQSREPARGTAPYDQICVITATGSRRGRAAPKCGAITLISHERNHRDSGPQGEVPGLAAFEGSYTLFTLTVGSAPGRA